MGVTNNVQKSSTETAHAPTFTNALIASRMHNEIDDLTYLVLKGISITQRVLYIYHAGHLKKPTVRAWTMPKRHSSTVESGDMAIRPMHQDKD